MKRGLGRHYPGIMLVVLISILLLQPLAFSQSVGLAAEIVVYSARIEALIKPMFEALRTKLSTWAFEKHEGAKPSRVGAIRCGAADALRATA